MSTKKKTQEEISAVVKRYYDSLTDEEAAEQRAWAEFVLAGLAETDWPDEDDTSAVEAGGEHPAGPPALETLTLGIGFVSPDVRNDVFARRLVGVEMNSQARIGATFSECDVRLDRYTFAIV